MDLFRLPAGPSFFLPAQKKRSKKKGLTGQTRATSILCFDSLLYSFFTLRFSPRSNRAPDPTKTYIRVLKQCRSRVDNEHWCI